MTSGRYFRNSIRARRNVMLRFSSQNVIIFIFMHDYCQVTLVIYTYNHDYIHEISVYWVCLLLYL